MSFVKRKDSSTLEGSKVCVFVYLCGCVCIHGKLMWKWWWLSAVLPLVWLQRFSPLAAHWADRRSATGCGKRLIHPPIAPNRSSQQLLHCCSLRSSWALYSLLELFKKQERVYWPLRCRRPRPCPPQTLRIPPKLRTQLHLVQIDFLCNIWRMRLWDSGSGLVRVTVMNSILIVLFFAGMRSPLSALGPWRLGIHKSPSCIELQFQFSAWFSPRRMSVRFEHQTLCCQVSAEVNIFLVRKRTHHHVVEQLVSIRVVGCVHAKIELKSSAFKL